MTISYEGTHCPKHETELAPDGYCEECVMEFSEKDDVGAFMDKLFKRRLVKDWDDNREMWSRGK